MGYRVIASPFDLGAWSAAHLERVEQALSQWVTTDMPTGVDHGAPAALVAAMRYAVLDGYEHVFLARQDLSQAQVDALAEFATKIVEDNKGKVVKTETWGLRTLTYKIQKNRKAHFVMLDIEANGDTIAELERQTRMNEDIIRYMTVRVDEHEKGPSVMMRKSDRPERSERGGFGGGDRDRGAPRPDRGDRPDRAPRAEQEA